MTPHLIDIPYVLMKHESKSQLDAKLKQMEKEGKDVSEASITKYFDQLDSPVVQAFIQHPMSTQNEEKFLKSFNRPSFDDPSRT